MMWTGSPLTTRWPAGGVWEMTVPTELGRGLAGIEEAVGAALVEGVPGAGVWAMTAAGGPGAAMWATGRSSSPRRRMLMEAVRSLCPMTLGMATCCAPRLSVTRTGHSRRTVTPGAGYWARTWPGGVLGE